MAEDLLARVLREIRERKQAAQDAYDESRRLERALAALGPDPRRSVSAPATEDGGRRTPAGRRRRAAPGANREAILAVVRERPGVTAGELVQVTRIPRSTVAPTLSRLLAAGLVERSELSGGGVGYRATSGAEATPAAESGGVVTGASDVAAQERVSG